jgi:hypothetical protein
VKVTGFIEKILTDKLKGETKPAEKRISFLKLLTENFKEDSNKNFKVPKNCPVLQKAKFKNGLAIIDIKLHKKIRKKAKIKSFIEKKKKLSINFKVNKPLFNSVNHNKIKQKEKFTSQVKKIKYDSKISKNINVNSNRKTIETKDKPLKVEVIPYSQFMEKNYIDQFVDNIEKETTKEVKKTFKLVKFKRLELTAASSGKLEKHKPKSDSGFSNFQMLNLKNREVPKSFKKFVKRAKLPENLTQHTKAFQIKIPLDEQTSLLLKNVRNNFYTRIITTPEVAANLFQNLQTLTQQLANLGFAQTVIRIQVLNTGNGAKGGFNNFSGNDNNKHKNDKFSFTDKESIDTDSFTGERISFSSYL